MVASCVMPNIWYIHHGSKVQCALLDMSKAFDMVDHGQLFESLRQRNLPNSGQLRTGTSTFVAAFYQI